MCASLQWPWIQNTICSNHDSESLPEFCEEWKETPSENACDSDQLHISLELKTDFYGRETKWEITTDEASEELRGGPYQPFSDYKITKCVSKACHSFNLFDSYGDGIYGKYGGGFQLMVDGTIELTGKPFKGLRESIRFGINC